MSATTVKLLQTASEIEGGKEALARRMGVSPALLMKFMTDTYELPDRLLLIAVDIVLEDRDCKSSPAIHGEPGSTAAAS